MTAITAPDVPYVATAELANQTQGGGALGEGGTEDTALGGLSESHVRVTRGSEGSAATPGWEPNETWREDGIRTGNTVLDEALGALQIVALAEQVTTAEAARAARLLRAAALERRLASPRIAGVALLLSDALLFTRADELPKKRRAPLREALPVLSASFVGQADEAKLVDSLLDNGWEVTAALDKDAFASVAPGVA